MPEKLWEIRSGKDRTYFLDRIAATYPAIRTFPQKQVLVFFEDTVLEEKLVETLNSLQADSKNGIISITSTGNLEFEEL